MIFLILIFFFIVLFINEMFFKEKYMHSLLSISDAKEMIKNKEIDIIIDVRTKFEWNRGRHPQAIHIPLGTLENYDFEEHKDKTILLYCRTGTRARMAMEMIQDRVHKVYYIDEGYQKLLD